jgi:hypothetical protein
MISIYLSSALPSAIAGDDPTASPSHQRLSNTRAGSQQAKSHDFSGENGLNAAVGMFSRCGLSPNGWGTFRSRKKSTEY